MNAPFKDYAEDHSVKPRYPFRGWIILGLALAGWAIIGLIAVIVMTVVAEAHDAPASVKQPLGWMYGWECCSMRDCAPVENAEIGESSAGYVIRRTGEVIAYDDNRIKRSKDEFYHRCSPAGNMDSPRSICLYVPDRGM